MPRIAPGAAGMTVPPARGGTSESAEAAPTALALVDTSASPVVTGAGIGARAIAIPLVGAALAGGAAPAAAGARLDPARIVVATCGLGSREVTVATAAGRLARAAIGAGPIRGAGGFVSRVRARSRTGTTCYPSIAAALRSAGATTSRIAQS
jgi:hypothetical protein